MELGVWLMARGGIAHRTTARRAGFTVPLIRESIRAGHVLRIRRHWIAVDSAPPEQVLAARAGGVVGCVTLARQRGWWVPDGVDARTHLHLLPHAGAAGLDRTADDVRLHWGRQIAPAPAHALVDSIEDALGHVAICLDPLTALVVWESAIRTEGLSVDALREVRWTSTAAAECADTVNGLSDSGLETIVVARLAPWGLPLRQQIVVAGHRVDLLVGARLVVQIDGYAHHSSAAQRGRDLAHDAELRLRGYTVLRFSYAQVVHDWASVERTVARAVAAGAHLGR